MRGRIFAVILSVLLIACGGGGGGGNAGGGSASSADSVTFSPASINFSVEAGTTTSFSFTATPSNDAEFSNISTLYVVVVDSQGIINQYIPTQNLISGYTLTKAFFTSQTLAPGAYQGNFQIYACSDAKCQSPLPGAPWNLPYNITVTKQPVVSTFAGSGQNGMANGPAAEASFNVLYGLVIAQNGNIFVADSGNNVIREIAQDGTVSTYAGTGDAGATNGAAASATFNNPQGIAIDDSGNLYVADTGNRMIRKITSDGIVSTLAGSGQMGVSDGQGAGATFFRPTSIVANAGGTAFVVDDCAVRQITPDGRVSLFAGTLGTFSEPYSWSCQPSSNPIASLALARDGTMYATGSASPQIFKVTSTGAIQVYAGQIGGFPGQNGPLAIAQFGQPAGLAVDSAGNLYVADYGYHLIRKVSVDGYVTDVAGGGNATSIVNGLAPQASFVSPGPMAVDGAGNIYLEDYFPPTVNGTNVVAGGGSVIRKITFQ